MGQLYFFNIRHLMQKYQTTAFIETGTGFGFGAYCATQYAFDIIGSIDIVESEIERLRPAFGFDQRVRLFAGKSPTVLRDLLPQIPVPIMFWLDAHFPGADLGKQAFGAVQDVSERLPLESELRVIKELRPEGKDVILIDDLRIYEHGDYTEGNLKQLGLEHIGQFGTNFLNTLFADTHVAERSLKDTGYMVLLPKQTP